MGGTINIYSVKKTLRKKSKSKKQSCPTCKRLFLRLDTHLRHSRSCQLHPNSSNVDCNLKVSPLHSDLLSDLPHGRQQIQATPAAVQLPSLKLPQSEEDWLESDRALARLVVPAVIAAPTVDAKHECLCQGIYIFSSMQMIPA